MKKTGGDTPIFPSGEKDSDDQRSCRMIDFFLAILTHPDSEMRIIKTDRFLVFFWDGCCLVGGFLGGTILLHNFFHYYPRGNDPIWLQHIFQMGGKKTTTLTWLCFFGGFILATKMKGVQVAYRRTPKRTSKATSSEPLLAGSKGGD